MINEKINVHQFLVLVTLFTIGTTILVVPSGLAAAAKQDAWIVSIVGTGIGFIVIGIFHALVRSYPEMTIIQMNEKLFGKWIGKIVSLIFISMPFIYTSILMIYNGSFLTSHIMPDTPVPVLGMLMIVIVVMGVRLGIETIARSAEIFLVFFFILFGFLVIFVSPNIEFENLQPVFESKINTIFGASLNLVVTSTINSVILLMIFPLVNRNKDAIKSFYIGNFIGGVAIIVITLLSILVLGADSTARQAYPSFILARRINVGNFIQRTEGVIAIMWFITIYFKMVLYFFATVLGVSQIFNLKHYRPLTLPMALIIGALSILMFEDVVKQQDFDVKVSIPFSITVGLFIPLILLLGHAIRKRKDKKKDDPPPIQRNN